MFILGDNPFQFRVLPLILSLMIIVLTYFMVLEFSQKRIVGLIAAFFMAINHYARFSSVLGERSELFVTLVLLFCYLIYRYRKKGSLISELCLGAVGGLMCLTWLFGGVGVVLSYVTRWIFIRLPWRLGVAGFLMFIGLLTPHLVYEKIENNDMFYSLNKSVNYFRNTEITGISSPEGGRRTWWEYAFREQGLLHMLKRVTKGYTVLFFNSLNHFNKIFMGFHYTSWYSFIIFPFYVGGVILFFRQKNWWVFFLLLFFTHMSPYSLKDILDSRLLFFMAPFFSAFIALGISTAIAAIGYRFSRRHLSSHSN